MELSQAFLILVPVIVGITQVVKAIGMDSRFAPLVSVILGVAGAFLISGISGGVAIGGIVAGLSACGLWSGVKTTTGN